jgi:acyl-CoA thioester hydrolase
MSQGLAQNQISARVYYKDTDAGGVVYYTRYAEFMEMGRTDWPRNFRFSALLSN